MAQTILQKTNLATKTYTQRPSNTDKKKSLLYKHYDTPANTLTEEEVLNLISPLIEVFVLKYRNIAKQISGGSMEDLRSELTIRGIEAYREWLQRIEKEGFTLKEKKFLDFIKFVSPRLKHKAIDISRKQKCSMFNRCNININEYTSFRAGINNYDNTFDKLAEDTYFKCDAETITQKVALNIWEEKLTDLQKKLVYFWKEKLLYKRKDPIKALLCEAKRRLKGEKIKTKEIEQAIRSMPEF